MLLKALTLVHFWSILLWKISKKSAIFYRLLFGEVCPENSREISRFFHEFVPKNPAKSDFFFRNLSEALPGIDLEQKRESW